MRSETTFSSHMQTCPPQTEEDNVKNYLLPSEKRPMYKYGLNGRGKPSFILPELWQGVTHGRDCLLLGPGFAAWWGLISAASDKVAPFSRCRTFATLLQQALGCSFTGGWRQPCCHHPSPLPITHSPYIPFVSSSSCTAPQYLTFQEQYELRPA